MPHPAWRWLRLALLLWLGAVAPAQAHKSSDSYLRLTVAADGSISGRWDIALRDIEPALGLDADGDGAITWGELRARHGDIAAWALQALTLSRDGQPCRIEAGEQLVDEHTDGRYTVLPLQASCPQAGQPLSIGYRLLADIDPQHRGLLALSTPQGVRSLVLDPAAPPVAIDLEDAGAGLGFFGFVGRGVWHIWIGLDHILFLLSLLLPAVLVWKAAAWQPVASLRAALIDVVKIVTAFTLAHSITLTLATLELITLPSRLVESVIALSVVLAALNNLRPLARGRRWMVAFGFGLVHGFGFASVLAELGLPQQALVLALLGFNLGVELGQLAIVAVFVPLAFALRRTRLYRRGVLFGGSLLIALVAAVWFVERAFDLKLVGL